MKLYAFTTPGIAENNGYLKIGETNGSVDKRIKDQGHTLNTPVVKVWEDAVVTDRSRIDKRIHQYLREQGFHNPQYPDTGEYTELIKCTVDDIKKAFEIIKQQIYNEEKQREEVGNQFYFEIRNWFYWTANAGNTPYSVAKAEYSLRLVIRLLLCFFLQEKELVPKELFDEQWIRENMKENEEYRYYNGILRNLFFHCLNTPLKNRKNFEYTKLIKNISNVKEQFQKIPFLNGGLFNEHEDDDTPLSNRYFFEELHTEHIHELGDNCKVEGIVRILSKYQYKLTLNDLFDHAEYTKTIDPEFLGKVFESLLSCVDADTKENRRKVTGSFYTPREIVDYMVNESLNLYLRNDIKNDLLQCKILDPACGSGAFPCGIMNEIVHRLDPDQSLSQSERYRIKLKILQNVIYGIDIQPIAVQIAILRLFLALIQEIKPDKKKDNYGIEPLPNLETKFVCANTLIGLRNGGQQYLQSPQVKAAIEMLALTRRQHLSASTVEEKERLQQYDEKQRKLLVQLMEENNELSDVNSQLLLDWNPYNQMKSSPFFDSIWMFGVEKFDIIIGNPPYNVIESNDKNKKLYEKNYNILKSGRINIYQLFFGRSAKLLSSKGTLSFIHPKTLLTDKYLTATRKFLLTEFPSFTIINIKTRKTTFNNVIQSVIISLWNKKDKVQNCRMSEIATKYDFKKLQYLVKPKNDIVTKEGTLLICPQDEFYTIEKKIRSVPHFLLQFTTGSIEWNKIKKHLSSQPKTNSKRLIYGENIQRFCFTQSAKRIKTTFISGKINIPTLQQLAVITQRTTAIEQPYRIIAMIIDPQEFDTSIVTENHTNVFLCQDKKTACFILGILNSRLMDLFFRFHNSNTQVSSSELNSLPIKKITKIQQQPIINLVSRILLLKQSDNQSDTSQLEAENNAIVFHLYGLTETEMLTVLRFLNTDETELRQIQLYYKNHERKNF